MDLPIPAGPGLLNPNNRYSVNVGLNHIFNPTFTMNLNFGVNRHVEQATGQGFGFQTSTLGFPSFVDSIAPAFPQISFNGGGNYAPLGANGGNNDYVVPQTFWTSSIDFTKLEGRHELSFGFTDVWLRIDGGHYGQTALNFQTASTAGPDPNNTTAGTGDGFAAFLLGVGSGGNGTSCQLCTSLSGIPGHRQAFPGLVYPGRLENNAQGHSESWLALRNPDGANGTPQRAKLFQLHRDKPDQLLRSAPLIPANLFSARRMIPASTTRTTTTSPRASPSLLQATNKLVVRAGYGIFFVPNLLRPGSQRRIFAGDAVDDQFEQWPYAGLHA